VRLFVALEIPSAVRDNLAAMIRELRPLAPQLKWVRVENLHITLKFIGETNAENLAAIRRALSSVPSRQSVDLHLRGLGFFPNEKRPAVLWAGIEASESLGKLAGDIDRALETVGIAREQRTFTPHLTIARVSNFSLPEKLRAGIQQNVTRDFGALSSREFHLIESNLKASGAEYTTLQSFSLVAAEA
jgi:RNA 2',3'-cyclic 3'-phosphodiesterase